MICVDGFGCVDTTSNGLSINVHNFVIEDAIFGDTRQNRGKIHILW